MTLKKLQTIQNVLDKMSKPEILLLARKYNQFVKIPNIYKMKKQELKIELLSNYEIVHDIWAGNKQIDIKKSERTPKKNKMSDEDINKLIKKNIELTEQAMKTNKTSEKLALLKEADKIQKKINKSI